jgi:hypothetical protein
MTIRRFTWLWPYTWIRDCGRRHCRSKRGAAEHRVQHRVLGRRERRHQIDSPQEMRVSDDDVIPGIADGMLVQAGEMGSSLPPDRGHVPQCIDPTTAV